MPKASILIRTRNEARFIGETLAAIRGQTEADFEIVVVDSGSNDDTVAIAERFDVQLLRLDPASFTYGRALNLGIENCHGDFIVSLSAHALPAGPQWLASMLGPFVEPQVAGVYGRHLPRPNVSPFELFGMYFTGLTSKKPRREAHQLRFSNTNGAFRRTIWEKLPFDEVLPGAEDLAWARQAHDAGYIICYEPLAAAYHSHGESLPRLLVRQIKDQPVRVRLLLGLNRGRTPRKSRGVQPEWWR